MTDDDGFKLVFSMWQKDNDDASGITTRIDVNPNLNPFEILFIWTSFHKIMAEKLLSSVGCSVPLEDVSIPTPEEKINDRT